LIASGILGARGLGPWLVVLLGTADPSLAPASAPAATGEGDPVAQKEDAVREATRHFKEGQRLFDAGDYVAAAEAFERSYAAIHTAQSLYNVALSFEKGDRPAQALTAAESYLELPDCGAPGHDPIHCVTKRSEVERTVERLRLRAPIEPEPPIPPSADLPMAPPTALASDTSSAPSDSGPSSAVDPTGPSDPSDPTGPSDPSDPTEPSATGETGREGQKPGRSSDKSKRRTPEERERLSTRLFWGGVGTTAITGVTAIVLGGLMADAAREFNEAQCRDECTWVDDDGQIVVETPYPQESEDRFYQLLPATDAMVAITATVGVATIVVGALVLVQRRKMASQRGSARVRVDSLLPLTVRW